MKVEPILRKYRHFICFAGVVRLEQPSVTVYAAGGPSQLIRQKRAMELVRHLEIAPPPASIKKCRGVSVLVTKHRPVTEFLWEWEKQTKSGKIELIRRLGATLGMVHSLKHSGTGDILNPNPKPVARHLTGVVRKNKILLSLDARDSRDFSGLEARILSLWGEQGGTLAGNWPGFPPVKVWEKGLFLMDLSRACFSEPLQDLTNIRPQELGLNDTRFFWEHFLQGYCATWELPDEWKAKFEVLYALKLLQAVVNKSGENEATRDLQVKWWDNI